MNDLRIAAVHHVIVDGAGRGHDAAVRGHARAGREVERPTLHVRDAPARLGQAITPPPRIVNERGR